jgi:DNA-binding response OmpR family regulator
MTQAEESFSSKKESILVVEDNQQMLEYICSHLEKDYKIETAVNGSEGYKKAMQTDPNLIISDVMMPEMDGYELSIKLKEDFRTSHIPVILLTAKIQDEDMLIGLEKGADAYLKKPFKAQELLVRIRNLIDNRQRLHKKLLTEKHLDFKKYNITSADERFLEKCRQVVEENLTRDDFSVEFFSSELAFSRVHIHRKLKSLTGLSISGYIKTIRLKRAASLLQKDYGNVAEIAYECGFPNPSYFAETFREMYHLSPTEYAREHKNVTYVI